MKFNLNKFKKIASDKTSSTLVSPEGHQIKMAHSALSTETRNKIKAMPLCEGGEVPHYDEGGPVSSDNTPNQSSDDQPVPGVNININTTPQGGMSVGQPGAVPVATNDRGQPFVTNAEKIKEGITGIPSTLPPAFDPEAAKQAGQDIVAQNAPPQAVPQDQGTPDQSTNGAPPIPSGAAPIPQNMNNYANPDMLAGYNKAANELRGGFAQEAAATRQQAIANQGIEQEHQTTLEHLQNDYQYNWDENTANLKSTIQDVQDGHIKPNHYLESMDSEKKARTAIGLILGGMGGGLLHQENPALKFLNAQIERDVDSQKANLSSQQTIMGAYLKQYGNITDAENMARATQNGIYSSKLKEAAANAADPMARARLLQQAGELDMKMAPLINQTSLRQAAMSTVQNPGIQDPASKIRLMGMAGLMSPKDQEAASKELGTKENLDATRDFALKSFDHLKDKFLKGALTPDDRESAIWSIAGKIQKDTEGRFNIEAAHKLVNAIFPNPLNFNSTVKNKRENLIGLFNTMGSTPTLDKYKISPHRGMANNQITEGAPVR